MTVEGRGEGKHTRAVASAWPLEKGGWDDRAAPGSAVLYKKIDAPVLCAVKFFKHM